MSQVTSKTPDEIMAWLAGLVCQVCGGQGGAQVAVAAPDGEQLGSELEGCTACGTTGRLLWRLVRPCTGCSEGGIEVEGVIVPRGTVTSGRVDDDGHIIWEPHESCGGTRLVTEKPTLDILIDTGNDLGFASVFTPEWWNELLPESWIKVAGANKEDKLLRNLEAAILRKGLAT